MPFWNSAMSLGPIFTVTRFLLGPPTASRSGLTPRAPADATVCDCCACEPPPGRKLAEHAAAFFGSSSFFFGASCVGGLLVVGRLLLAPAAGEAARTFGNRRDGARRLGVEGDVLGVARLHRRRRRQLLLSDRLRRCSSRRSFISGCEANNPFGSFASLLRSASLVSALREAGRRIADLVGELHALVVGLDSRRRG